MCSNMRIQKIRIELFSTNGTGFLNLSFAGRFGFQLGLLGFLRPLRIPLHFGGDFGMDGAHVVIHEAVGGVLLVACGDLTGDPAFVQLLRLVNFSRSDRGAGDAGVVIRYVSP